jgi:hypothetical protein
MVTVQMRAHEFIRPLRATAEDLYRHWAILEGADACKPLRAKPQNVP